MYVYIYIGELDWFVLFFSVCVFFVGNAGESPNTVLIRTYNVLRFSL